MCRLQKTMRIGCPCEGMVETESNKGVRSTVPPKTAENDGAENLLERMLDRDNLNLAFKRVKKNKGSAGICGMTVDEMLPYLKEHRNELLESIRGGWYKPQPVRRVEIPSLTAENEWLA